MAATNTQSLNALIRTEQFAEDVEGAVYHPNPYQGMVWRKDASEGRSPKCKFPRWNAIEATSSEANPKAENAEPSPPIEITADAAEATAEVVDIALELTWEAEQDAQVSMADLAQVAIPALRQRIAKDCFLNLQSATKVSNYAGQALNISRVGEVFADWDMQLSNPAAGATALVLAPKHLAQFRAALRASGSSLHVDPELKELFGLGGTYIGTYEQTPVLSTALMPMDGPTDQLSAMLKLGQQAATERETNRFAGLAIASWWGDDVERGMHAGFRFVVKEHERGASYLYVSARYGTTLANPANSRAIIGKAA